ncbi:hypothetical protein K7395_00150 [Streptomyces filamentosus]|uniref:Integral membrane protein n=1 Tax=Streptomyces filamentosus TaxID=67294 RepID=A0ABY4V4M3_STRFL|nr:MULTISPECIES: hypothetical protein [Streptomyces]ESU51409.1 hypothetical protein P376_0592 [Streptomyces sp. HCCB10043]MYR83340.1 hypothetical protein [Streptomyces sp. SID5466]USC51435.1 hypothetical protein K7395_00150 [Streptomyces filamentosus]
MEASGDGSAGADEEEADQSADRKGGPGHTVLLAVALAVPVTKVAYTVGGGAAARDVFIGMEPANWPDVLIGMVLTDPLLASVLAVVVSRVVFALFAARGAVPAGGGVPRALQRAALTLVNPVATGVVVACFFGPWWGLGTGLTAYALRKGVVVEYRTGRRRPRGHRHGGYRPSRGLRRAAALEQWVALGLTALALPVLAFVAALDGQAWTSIVRCQVTDGTRTENNRLIELGRKGNGVVGWNLDKDEISNGAGCAGEESLYVREPWWRG